MFANIGKNLTSSLNGLGENAFTWGQLSNSALNATLMAVLNDLLISTYHMETFLMLL